MVKNSFYFFLQNVSLGKLTLMLFHYQCSFLFLSHFVGIVLHCKFTLSSTSFPCTFWAVSACILFCRNNSDKHTSSTDYNAKIGDGVASMSTLLGASPSEASSRLADRTSSHVGARCSRALLIITLIGLPPLALPLIH